MVAAAEVAAAAPRGRSSSNGSYGILWPAADANWRPEMTCAFPGPDSYALLFLFRPATDPVLLLMLMLLLLFL